MTPEQNNFLNKKWGVFNHYLFGMQNGTLSERNPSGKITDWNTCVDEFDVEKFAHTLHKMKAGYYFITIQQATKYMCAPNETYDKLIGAKPGEACSLRDLPNDLYKALSKYDIDLYLYMCATGPWLARDIGNSPIYLYDPEKAGQHDTRATVTDEFVKAWASVMQEYSERYGDKVKGWWIDSCYEWLGFNDDNLKYYYDALKKGHPNALTAFNVAGTRELAKGFSKEEYICGEKNAFNYIPLSREIDGAQAHVFAPLGILPDWAGGGAWGFGGCKHTKEYMLDYTKLVNSVGSPVTVDIVVYRDGSLEASQEELLTYMGNNL